MKFIENATTWDMLLMGVEAACESENTDKVGAVGELGQFTGSENNATQMKKDTYLKDEIQQKCQNLAAYSYEEDIVLQKISEQKLEEKIKAGELFSSHIFVRLAKHFTLEEKVEKKDRKKQIELVQTLHAFLGNQYYYKVDEETIQKLCRWGILYPDKYSYFREHDAFLKRYIEAARYFKERGFEIRIEGGEIYFDDVMGQQLFDMLDKKIATLGGNYVLEKVLGSILMEDICRRWTGILFREMWIKGRMCH